VKGTKLWITRHQKVEQGINETLKELGLDYIDLYLLHFPVGERLNGTAVSFVLDHVEVSL
jgi:glycerol 2-dehydrogenase (NADP+)